MGGMDRMEDQSGAKSVDCPRIARACMNPKQPKQAGAPKRSNRHIMGNSSSSAAGKKRSTKLSPADDAACEAG